VSAENPIKITSNISFEEAAMTEPVACRLNALSRMNIRRGDGVVIMGGGFMNQPNM